MKGGKRTEYFICETISRPVTKREFLRLNKEEAVGDCILLSEIVKRRIFTRLQVNTLIRSGILKPVKYSSRVYFKKDSVSEGIRYFSESPKLF